MTKKLLSLLLASAILLSLLPAALAEDIVIVDPEEVEIVILEPAETQPPIDPADAAANERTIYSYLRETMGLNTAAACGILTNIWCESGFDPHALGDGGSSYGICQWHNERWDSLKSYCNQHGYDWQTLEGQLHFLQYELTGFFPGLCATLANAENNPEGAYDAGYAWCYSFERPYDYPNVSVTRGNAARRTYWPKYVTASGSQPVAQLEEAVGGAGLVRVRGWAFDWDQTAGPVSVRVTVGGEFGSGAECHVLKADGLRTDIGAAYPGAGNNHGFSAELKLAARGEQTLYFYASDLAGGYPAMLFATAQVVISAAPGETEEPPQLSLAGMSTAGTALSWTAVEGATAYELLRFGSEGQSTVSTDRTAYLDASTLMGESYAYSVRAFANGIWTEYSADLELLFNPFTDVSGKKTLEYLAWAYNNGVVKGTGTTKFSPNRPCSRIQFVMMLWKMHGSPEVGGTNPFSDISGGKTTAAILWALDAGVINTGGRFDPDRSITRAEIVMILWKLSGSPEPEAGENPFADLSGAKLTRAVLWAWQNGVTKGTDSTHFSPDSDCTRIQLVVFLYKYNGICQVPVNAQAPGADMPRRLVRL